MQHWLKLGFPKNKLLLGLASYGRTFTLANSANHNIGSLSWSPGTGGEYTREAGFLSYFEVISTHALNSVWL